ncbi:hypothetical protein JCM8208_005480 [Rhodotorula glutinis]
MLRLTTLSPSPSASSRRPLHRALAARHHRISAPPPPHHHHHNSTRRMWTPGSPIVFGGPAEEQVRERATRSGSAGRAWTAADPVVFGVGEGGRRGAKGLQEARGALREGGASSPTLSRPSFLDSFARPSGTPSPRAVAAAASPVPPSAPPPPPSASAAHTNTAPNTTPSALSQKELDDLVAGIDFDDALDLDEPVVGPDLDLVEPDAEPASERPPPALTKQASLAPDELERLVDGIDFSQDADLLLSDLDEPGPVVAAASTSSSPASRAGPSRPIHLLSHSPPPPPPASAPRATPSPRLGFRTCAPTRTRTPAPSSPRPEPPQHARDLFSPNATAADDGPALVSSSRAQASPSRRASPFRPALGTPLAAAAFAAAHSSPQARSIRAYSSSPGSPSAPRVAPLGTSSSGGGGVGASAPTPRTSVIELLSDESDAVTSSPDLVVVVRKPRQATTTAAPLGARTALPAAVLRAAPGLHTKPKGGWFQRPAGRAPPASAYSTSTSASASTSRAPAAPAPSSATSSSTSSSLPRPRPVLAPGVPSRTAPPSRPTAAARTRLLKPPRVGSKRHRDAEKQELLRAKWDKTFSFLTWPVEACGDEGERPRMVYTVDEREVDRVLPTLKGPLGFDLEWDPYVPKLGGNGGPGKAALVQVCDADTILLVHVARMSRFPPALKQLVEDPERLKLGVQIAGDAAKLKRDFAHNAQGLLELNACVRAYDPARFVDRSKPGLIGLQELVGMYLDAYLPKEQDVRCARWSGTLSTEQLEYAANDVYASLLVLRAIQSFSDLSADAATADLRRLSTTPYNPWSGFTPSRAAAPTSASSTTGSLSSLAKPFPNSTLPAAARVALSDRKFEALALFHDERLALRDMTARMSASTPLKPVSAAWNVLSAAAKLRERGVEVEWDVARLVALVDEVEGGSAKRSMLREHGEMLEKLKAGATASASEAA